MSELFMSNRACPWFPCHRDIPEEGFNCLFCYCPLFPYEDCQGNYTLLANGWKDCSHCTFPHLKDNASVLIERLIHLHERG